MGFDSLEVGLMGGLRKKLWLIFVLTSSSNKSLVYGFLIICLQGTELDSLGGKCRMSLKY